MNMKIILLIMFLLAIVSSCQDVQQSSGTYEISLGDSDKQYVPSDPNQLLDYQYMNKINSLIEQIVDGISSDTEFLRLAKAIAWTESKWKHYYQQNDRYYVFLGDSGHSFGIMQIYDTYHGQHPILQENLEYGINFAYEKYQTAQGNQCSTGTNAGASSIAIARRTYAQYNGGNGAICRDNDGRDNNLEEAYTGQSWLSYM